MTDPKAEVVGYLAGLEGAGIRLGLERVTALAARLGDPQLSYPVILVAGTNGKGSVSATLVSVLSRGGYRVGFYLSPHLNEVNERIRIGFTPVSYEHLNDDLRAVREASEGAGEDAEPTYFEALTLAAFRRFAVEEVDVAVVEVGMGGRLDATNIAVPKLAIITEIDKDHMEYLGGTLEEIAREKLGIVREGVPVVIGTRKRPLARFMADLVAGTGGIPHVAAGGCFGKITGMDLAGQTVDLVTPLGPFTGVRMGLIGRHQLDNLLTATLAIDVLRGLRFPVSEEAYRRGVASVSWPGRFQVWSTEPPVILDGAHNPAGIAALMRTVRDLFGEQRGCVLLIPLKEKNLMGIMSHLSPWARKIFVAPLAGPRRVEPASLKAMVRSQAHKIEPAASIEEGIAAARGALLPGEPLIITGSLAGLGQASEVLPRIVPPKERA